MDMLARIPDLFQSFLAHAHLVSLILGLVGSIGLTQLAKFPIRYYFHVKGLDPQSSLTPEIAVSLHLWAVRAFAVLIGAVLTFATWPDGTLAYKVTWSAVVGAAAPIAYTVVTHFLPWLGERASADRRLPPPPPPPDGTQ